MKAAKTLVMILLVAMLATPALATEKISLVIGKNLKVGMSIHDVIALLGIPQKIQVIRGTEPLTDSVAIKYREHGVVIHSMHDKTLVEQIEILPAFKGTFAEGIKIGAKFPEMIDKYGMPDTLSSDVARYPDRGLYFVLQNEKVVSAKVFKKNSKILALRMINK